MYLHDCMHLKKKATNIGWEINLFKLLVKSQILPEATGYEN